MSDGGGSGSPKYSEIRRDFSKVWPSPRNRVETEPPTVPAPTQSRTRAHAAGFAHRETPLDLVSGSNTSDRNPARVIAQNEARLTALPSQPTADEK